MDADVRVGSDRVVLQYFAELLLRSSPRQHKASGELEAQAERMTLGSDGVQIDEAAAKRKWMLLMQVESKEAVYGHMWGDSGCLYFMIPRSDLKASVFTNVRCILQCS